MSRDVAKRKHATFLFYFRRLRRVARARNTSSLTCHAPRARYYHHKDGARHRAEFPSTYRHDDVGGRRAKPATDGCRHERAHFPAGQNDDLIEKAATREDDMTFSSKNALRRR